MTGLRRRTALPAALATLLVTLGACGYSGAQARSADSGPGSSTNGTLTVFAAASLTDAFTALANAYEQCHGDDVRISFASSATLASQIRHGAPAEVFAAADEAQMDRVADSGLVTYGPEAFATSRLIVLVPDDNPAGIETFEDLARPGARLVLAAEGVPVAEYAERALNRSAARYGPRFRPRVLDNLVSREADVRAAVNRVVLGDADATFAYASDVTPDVRRQVRIVEIPTEMNVTATYHMGVLTRAESKEQARQWMAFVRSDTGRRVLNEWGFQPARSR